MTVKKVLARLAPRDSAASMQCGIHGPYPGYGVDHYRKNNRIKYQRYLRSLSHSEPQQKQGDKTNGRNKPEEI